MSKSGGASKSPPDTSTHHLDQEEQKESNNAAIRRKSGFSPKFPEISKRKESFKDPGPIHPTSSSVTTKRSLKQLAPPPPEDDALILKGEEIALPPLETSFGYFLFDRLKVHKDRILQVDANSGNEVRGMELSARAICVAMELRTKLGEQVTEGSKIVAAVLDNGTSASYALIGTLFAGAIFVPVNPDLNEDDLKHVLTLLSPDFVFCTPRALNNVKAVLDPKCFILETCHGCKMWDEIINQSRNKDLSTFKLEKDIQNLDDPIIIMCSAGTTGPPKGVMFSHKTIHHMVLLREVQSHRKPVGADAETTLVVNPFSWVSGLIPILSSCASGWLLLQFARFDVDRVLGAVQEHRVTAVTVTSPLVATIASAPSASRYDFSAVALFRFGGSPLSREVQKKAEDKMKKKLIYHYGLTECPWPVTAGPKSYEKANTVGVVAPNTWIKIADFKTGRALGHNREGEICIKSELMFTGYYNDPNANAEALDPYGWLHTEDVGYYDTDHYIYMTDRFKELIKCRGHLISPKEIEDVIMQHEAVQDVAVVGVHDDKYQEHPVAVVVVKPGHIVSQNELTQMVLEKLPDYKQFHGEIYFGTEIPKSEEGKIKRRELSSRISERKYKKNKKCKEK